MIDGLFYFFSFVYFFLSKIQFGTSNGRELEVVRHVSVPPLLSAAVELAGPKVRQTIASMVEAATGQINFELGQNSNKSSCFQFANIFFLKKNETKRRKSFR